VRGVFEAPGRATVSWGGDETAGSTRMIMSGLCPAAAAAASSPLAVPVLPGEL